MQLRHSGKYFTDRYLISIQQMCGQTVNPESHYKIMRHWLTHMGPTEVGEVKIGLWQDHPVSKN